MQDPADHVTGPECPSDSDAEKALTNAALAALPLRSSDRDTTDTTPNVHVASTGEDVPSGTENCNYLTSNGGVRRNRERQRAVFLSAFSTTLRAHATSATLPRMRRVTLTVHRFSWTCVRQNRDNKSSQFTIQNVNWIFRHGHDGLSTQHLAVDELACQVCGLLSLGSETRRCRFRCWIRCGVAGSTSRKSTVCDGSLRQSQLLMALVIDWCMSSHCVVFWRWRQCRETATT